MPIFWATMLIALIVLLTSTNTWAKLGVRAAVLMNMNTGRILYEQNAHVRIPPASLTKIMTMYIALDRVSTQKLSLAKPVRVSHAATSTGGSRMNLKTGETLPLDTLLIGMAVASGNDASMAVAQHVSTSSGSFVTLMNKKAASLGMPHTTFKTPHGLPAKGQLTTARDMLTLARSYLRVHPAAIRYHSIPALRHNGVLMHNTNTLLGVVDGLDGLKTGWIAESGYNLIFTAKRGNTRLLGVILGGATREQRDIEARHLIEAGFQCLGDPQKVERHLRGRR